MTRERGRDFHNILSWSVGSDFGYYYWDLGLILPPQILSNQFPQFINIGTKDQKPPREEPYPHGQRPTQL